MSIRQIMHKYGVTNNFQVMAVREVLFLDDGDIAVNVGEIVELLSMNKKNSNQMCYFRENGVNFFIDIDVNKTKY